MSRRSTTASVSKSKTIKQLQYPKKSSTANSLYSGMSYAQRTTQQQQRYVGSSPAWRSTQPTRGSQGRNTTTTKNLESPAVYHPWESEFSRIIIREKKIKCMTKDPYTPMTRLIAHAVERIANETKSPPLISAKAVRNRTVKIRQQPKPSLPVVIRYLRRNELMPSERLMLKQASMKVSLLSQSENKTSIVSMMNVSKITPVAPTLVTTARLLNRAKIRTNPPVIRRPPRKLMITINHESTMPLSAYS